jgi:hypothetical protein
MTTGEMFAGLDLLFHYVPSLFNGCQTIESVNTLKSELQGRDSILVEVMKGMGDIPADSRADMGVLVNAAKHLIDFQSNKALERLGSGYYQ